MHSAFESNDEEEELTFDSVANTSISELLGTDVIIVPKPDDSETNQIKVLTLIVNTLEQGIGRRTMLQHDYGMNLEFYDEIYEEALLNIATKLFGDDVYEWIQFYVHERIDEETGLSRHLEDSEGNKYYLNNPRDLWNVIKKSNSSPATEVSRRKKKK